MPGGACRCAGFPTSFTALYCLVKRAPATSGWSAIRRPAGKDYSAIKPSRKDPSDLLPPGPGLATAGLPPKQQQVCCLSRSKAPEGRTCRRQTACKASGKLFRRRSGLRTGSMSRGHRLWRQTLGRLSEPRQGGAGWLQGRAHPTQRVFKSMESSIR